jgi:hypothetical protein
MKHFPENFALKINRAAFKPAPNRVSCIIFHNRLVNHAIDARSRSKSSLFTRKIDINLFALRKFLSDPSELLIATPTRPQPSTVHLTEGKRGSLFRAARQLKSRRFAHILKRRKKHVAMVSIQNTDTQRAGKANELASNYF